MRYLLAASVLSLILFAGCAPKAPLPKPPVVTAPEISPIIGTWENNVRGVSHGRVIFSANGTLMFQGGMEFYNPGRWDWDPIQKKLYITLPQAPDPKLDIFKMYVGDGVEAFDRAQKRVTYHFDEETATLNIGGWTYAKVNEVKPAVPEEPTLH